MDAFKPFVTQGGYEIEFYDAPAVVEKDVFAQYVKPDDMLDRGVERMLQVSFLVRDEADIGSFRFLTSAKGGNIVVPADKVGEVMYWDMQNSGDLEDLVDEMKNRFQYGEETPLPKLDDVLDKINSHGMESLSDIQKQVLTSASNEKINTHMEKFVPLFEDFTKSYMDLVEEPGGHYMNKSGSARTADIPYDGDKKIEWKYDYDKSEWYAHIEGNVTGRYFERWKRNHPKPVDPPMTQP